MARYTVTSWSGPHGDVRVSSDYGSAEFALKMAEAEGTGVTISTEDGKTYEISEFIDAMSRGEV